ncbi:MAG: low temperature requirement protein A [Microterricola sp.]
MSELSATQEAPQQAPRRTAAWYELFFDLVFVVVIALSAHLIEVDPSLNTVLLFALVFFPLWWAWVNLMVTSNLFGRRHPAIPVLVVVAMPGPAMMAIAIAGGLAELGWLYAVGAAWIRLVLLVMWLIPRALGAVRVPLWRPLAYNLGTAALWLASILVPEPYRYLLWVAAVAAEVLLLALRRGGFDEIYEQASISHLLERVGLFVVIVIGEAVYLSVTALAEHPSVGGGAAALFGLVLCAFLARAFFRWGAPTAEVGLLRAQRSHSFGVLRDVTMYLPFLLVTALTLIAAAIGSAVERGNEALELPVRVLLAVGIGGFYLANALVGVRLGRPLGRIMQLLVPGLALPALACFLSGALAAWATLALAALALVLLDLVSRLLGARAAAAAPGIPTM